MKILLVGEYSGLHLNLKKGLEYHGHAVKTIGGGDGFKKIESDILLQTNYKGRMGRYHMRFLFLKALLFKRYDVIQVINPFIFPKKMAFLIWILIRILNKKVFLAACGDDICYLKFIYNKGMKYSPYMEKQKINLPFRGLYYNMLQNFVGYLADGIIPVMYEYAEAHRRSKYAYKIKRTIPLPIYIKEDEPPKFDEEKRKLIIFHGINREDFKGSDYITSALKKLKNKYPERVDIIIDGKLPLRIYLKLMEKTDIVVDQCKSYSYGMNALYAMMQGKIVLSGSEEECLKEFNLESIPVINILPDEDDIFKKLETLILKPDTEISNMKQQSYDFVKNFHNAIDIAKEYIQVYEQNRF